MNKDTLQARDVQNVIRQQIERREKRITELQAELKRNIITPNRMVEIAILIDKFDHAIATFIELEHVLRLCDCPDEAYASKEATNE